VFTVLGRHRGGHRRDAFAKLSQQLWRVDAMHLPRNPSGFITPAAVFSTCRRWNAISSNGWIAASEVNDFHSGVGEMRSESQE